jgi:F420-dependent oxidoreductase-like protein
MTIGIQLSFREPRELVAAVQRAEERGVDAVWLPQGGMTPDTMMLLSAAAMVTSRIKFGTSIIPTWPRAPIFIAQQVMALDGLAPGRFRLGIGPSTPAAMGPMYGVDYREPMAHLREYLTILRAFLHGGNVDFQGKFAGAKVRLREPELLSRQVPVMASALSPGAYRVCGEMADGAISWMSPWRYLRDTALPALREGAAAAGREAPPLIAHVPVCLDTDPDVVRAAVQDQVGAYGKFPVYQAMFRASGYGDTAEAYPQALIDELVLSGDEDSVIERFAQMQREGVGEIMAHCIYVGTDRATYLDRLFDLLARASRELG